MLIITAVCKDTAISCHA